MKKKHIPTTFCISNGSEGANINGSRPLNLQHDLKGKCHAICHYSYNLPLMPIKTERT